MTKISRYLAPAGVAFAAGLFVLLLVPGSGGASSMEMEQPGQDNAWALDAIPGFGITSESILRDDAIAYWEAYKRDSSVQECMATQGFVWEIEALYPGDTILEIAKLLDAGSAAGSTVPSLAPSERNTQQVVSFSDSERNAYYVALYGETADTIDYVESNDGSVPPGIDAGSFATGGCRGAADSTQPGIWTVPRQLAATLDEIRSAERGSGEFLSAQASYQECASNHGARDVSSPADLDVLITGLDGAGLDPIAPDSRATVEVVTEVERECHAIWEAATVEARKRAGAALLASESAVLEQQQSRYADAIEQMRRDSGFMRYLAEEAARITAEMHG